MIKETKEFKDFNGIVEDSGGNVRYAKHQNEKIKIDDNSDVVNDWIPEPAYALAHQFRSKHGGELTVDLVNTLLSDLNKIWREREKKQISRIKQ